MGVEDLDVSNLSRIGVALGLDETHVARLKTDFGKTYFKGFLTTTNDTIDGILFYYFAYSTWEARVLYISRVWLRDDQDEDKLSMHFKSLLDALVDRARQLNVSRINYNSNMSDWISKRIGDWLVGFYGARDLGHLEKWIIFRMEWDTMTQFAANHRDHIEYEAMRFAIEDANVEQDGQLVCDLIRELAEFELMPDQFKLTKADLIRDSSKYYHCLIVRNCSSSSNEIVAFILYYYSYDVNMGLGCYLDDLYVKVNYRHMCIGDYIYIHHIILLIV
jgi:hypothetical protein